MPITKVVRRRGATTTVQANAEVMFLPGGSIHRWQVRIATAVTRATAFAAPTNKRPRWVYNGKRLKNTFNSRTEMDAKNMRAVSVVGSSAAHAIFVDQGTGSYQAKILPPWVRGGGSLYESTWRPSPNSAPQGTITVRGQRAQGFFAKGLKRGMESKRLPSVEVPDSAIAGRTRPTPTHLLASVLGGEPNDMAFRAQLEQWREWRDRAFLNPDRPRIRKSRSMGPGYKRVAISADERRARNRESQRRARARNIRRDPKPTRTKTTPNKPTRTPKNKTRARATSQGRNQFLAAMSRKYGWADRNTLVLRDGYYYVVVRTRGANGKTEYREVRGRAR